MNEIAIQILQQKVAYERDQVSYKMIFSQFYHPLLQFAKSLVKLSEVSEEIVSDVMMKIWEMKEDLARVAHLKIYLYRAIHNRCINYLNREGKIRDLSLEQVQLQPDVNFYVANPEEIMLRKERCQAVKNAIHSLPPQCQVVYKLVREDAMTYKEVAAVLSISTKTVDRHLNNALHKLMESLRPQVVEN